MHLTRIPGSTRFIALAVAMAVLLFMFQGTSNVRPAEATTNCNVADLTFDAQEQAFLQLINDYRAQHGLPALTASVNLNRAASWMAHDMATKRYFSHTDSLGRSASQRVTDCGGKPNVGENLAAGTYRDSAQSAFTAWRNSPGHNSNMLNPHYKQIGIARYYDASSPYRWYWVTNFSTTNDGTNALNGGGTAPAPEPEPVVTAAEMQSPASGARLSTTTTFQWSGVEGAHGYHLYIGTSTGSANMLSAGLGTRTSVTVSGFPRTGQTVYLRLWTLTDAGWQYNDYTYRLPR